MENNGRQKIVFIKGKSKDGSKDKLMGRSYDGCIVFPDRFEEIKIIPNREYMATIYKHGNTAFAKQIVELEE